MPLNMQPLSDKFGVAITNVDLSKDVDQSLFNEIVDVFVKPGFPEVAIFSNEKVDGNFIGVVAAVSLASNAMPLGELRSFV